MASYLTQDEQDGSGEETGHAGWVMPLHVLRVDSIAGQPEYMRLDATTAAALGAPATPHTIWLLVPGQPPCHATIGPYYGAAVDSSVPNVTYGVELEGCPAPPKDQQQDAEAIAVMSSEAPTGCQVLRPQLAALRLGETDAQKHWQRPTKQTPIPPALAAVVPLHDCQAPGCEMLWTIAQVDVANRPIAWAGAVNWLAIPQNASPASQCEWKVDTFAGFFIAGPDGRAVKITAGQDHPLLLTAVLADHEGAKVMIAEGAGEYSTYDLLNGTATLRRHMVWLLLPPDAYALDERLGPSCGPDPDRR